MIADLTYGLVQTESREEKVRPRRHVTDPSVLLSFTLNF